MHIYIYIYIQYMLVGINLCINKVPVTRIGQSHLTKTFNGSHPLNVFAEQLLLNA